MRDDRGGGRGGDRPKKSWREVDAIRDKSRQRDGDPQRKASSPAAMQAAKSYRAALEKAFESGTLAELAKTLAGKGDEAGAPAAAPHGGTPPNGSSAAGATPAQGTTAPDAALSDDAPAPSAIPPPSPRDPERENRMKLLVKIKEAEGRDVITRAVDAYLAKYTKLPADYEVLTKVLSHKDDDRVRDALALLAELAAREKPRRGRALVGQLRFLEETHGDADIRKTAADIRAKL